MLRTALLFIRSAVRLMYAELPGAATRYRLLETVCEYALEKLGESGEADTARTLTATTTRRWLLSATRRQTVIMSSLSSRAKPRSTTCEPRSGGVGSRASSSVFTASRRRCADHDRRGELPVLRGMPEPLQVLAYLSGSAHAGQWMHRPQ